MFLNKHLLHHKQSPFSPTIPPFWQADLSGEKIQSLKQNVSEPLYDFILAQVSHPRPCNTAAQLPLNYRLSLPLPLFGKIHHTANQMKNSLDCPQRLLNPTQNDAGQMDTIEQMSEIRTIIR
jgi:hypothetical protein